MTEDIPLEDLAWANEHTLYQIAWKILDITHTFNVSKFFVPSTRKSKLVDEIAGIIGQEL